MKTTLQMIPIEKFVNDPKQVRLTMNEDPTALLVARDGCIMRGEQLTPLLVKPLPDGIFQIGQGHRRRKMFEFLQENHPAIFEQFYAKGVKCLVADASTTDREWVLACLDQEESQGLLSASEIAYACIRLFREGFAEKSVIRLMFPALSRTLNLKSEPRQKYLDALRAASTMNDAEAEIFMEAKTSEILVSRFHTTVGQFYGYLAQLPEFVFLCWRALENGSKAPDYPEWVPTELRDKIPNTGIRSVIYQGKGDCLIKAFRTDLDVKVNGKPIYDENHCGPAFQKAFLALLGQSTAAKVKTKTVSVKDVKESLDGAKSAGVCAIKESLNGTELTKETAAKIDAQLLVAEYVNESTLSLHDAISLLQEGQDDDVCDLLAGHFFARLGNRLREDIRKEETEKAKLIALETPDKA